MTQQRSARVITTIGRLILISIVGCGPASQQPVRLADAQHPNDDVSADSKKIVPPIPPEKAPDPSPRLGDENLKDRIFQPIESYFEGNHGNRSYLQLDKPLYRPGETVWFRSFTLSNRSLAGASNVGYMSFQLVSPRGSSVMEEGRDVVSGFAHGAFDLPSDLAGGEYILRATSSDGTQTERPFIVSSYEAPRIKKELEFLRKAYGKGDTVQAALTIKRPTGEVMSNHPVEALVQLDDKEIARIPLATDSKGSALVRFQLPALIDRGDGLLTVLTTDGGVTESISKRIPIVLDKVQLSLFPEGGKLVTGLPSRVYFEAQNMLGKPADIEGSVLDDQGKSITTFKSYYQGMGRFEFRPESGRRYAAKITKPAGIKDQFDLPVAEQGGCTLRSFDDFDSQIDAIRVAVQCTSPQSVTVTAMLRENLLDYASVNVSINDPSVVYLKSADNKLSKAQGIVRLTVFDEKLQPLVERLIYRNRRNNLQVLITPDKASYTPRDNVSLQIETKDSSNNPVSADLALSVADDTVISYADDKTGHLLSRLYLESEIPEKVEEPKVYFDLTEKKAAKGLDLLLGTKGFRTFEWYRVFVPPPTSTASVEAIPTVVHVDSVPPQHKGRKEKARTKPVYREKNFGPVKAAAGAGAGRPEMRPKKAAEQPVMLAPQEAAAAVPLVADLMAPDKVMLKDQKLIAELPQMMKDEEPVYDEIILQPVRVFPVPDYSTPYNGPRTDFRDTVYWAPQIRTDENGKAKVSFYLSDAVTSFRVFAEGVGSSEGGRTEKVFKSNLPFSMNIKVPTEVSSGDQMKLPLTLTNETDRPLQVFLEADFGELMTMDKALKRREISLAKHERKSLIFDVKVEGTQGSSAVSVKASAGGLFDSFERVINVASAGFPVEMSLSGKVKLRSEHRIDLTKAVKGSISVTLKAYPSPTATMLGGMEGMLNQPYGCFEQASSTNYPNVMILDYLDRNSIADPSLTEKSRDLLDTGYRLLTGYESPQQGYEWFGGNPGHEALTAYGLLEFIDMKRVYGTVNQSMIDRTAKWLLSRRDDKGGFLRNPQALDSFGAASPEVTNAYIIYSLTEAGYVNRLEREIQTMRKEAAETKDSYILALAACSLLNSPNQKAQGKAAAARLVKMQSKEGAWTEAEHSITRSGGKNLHIETTALAVIALLKAGGYETETERAVQWLLQNRDGYGNWGATQATVLGIKAFAAYSDAVRKTEYPGNITLLINDKVEGSLSYEAGHIGILTMNPNVQGLKPGVSTVKLMHEGGGELPYSMAIEYRSIQPASSDASPVDLAVRSSSENVALGEIVRLTASVTNRTQSGLPMTLVRVGLPGGLTFQTWQLKELRDKKLIDFYETRPREVILYFRDMKPNDRREIPLDLVAVVPGSYTGPASSAYLYYTDEHKTWSAPLSITVTSHAN